MPIRGIRGATSVEENTTKAILFATRELLEEIKLSNPTLAAEDIASIIFTLTSDLNAVYPAQAARAMGWDMVPLMCAVEIPVPGSLPMCIRILIHWNTPLDQNSIHHCYCRQAIKLRPDLIRNLK